MSGIDAAFIKNFESEVHVAYQMMGSKLRGTVRTKDGVAAKSTTFQKVGKGVAGEKQRHGKVPTMNVHHEPVECLLHDYYAGDWVDRLDELKTNINEQKVVARAGAFALGRKTDAMIFAAAMTTSNSIGSSAAAIGLDRCTDLLVAMGNADVPDDGGRYVWVSWRVWADLLEISQFANLDYVGSDGLVWKGSGAQGKNWLGAIWMPHSGIDRTGGVATCIAYHRSAIGHAIGADVQTDVTWHGDRAAHFVNNMMSQGVCIIDETGVFKLPCLES
ncbi:MAG TPA: phage capsid protein [Candidatus Defluviicoccus seviourii]|nr:phage capsid protein [Candidatus Defluviicoccus seviourii]